MSVQPRVWGMLSSQASAELRLRPQKRTLLCPLTETHGSLSTAYLASMPMHPHICVNEESVLSVTPMTNSSFVFSYYVGLFPSAWVGFSMGFS